MTLWFDAIDRPQDEPPGDHSTLFRYIDELDQLCEVLQVRPLSEFFDESALRKEIAAEMAAMPGFESRTSDLPSTDEEEHGWAVSWFDPAFVLATVDALHEHLHQHAEAVAKIDFMYNAEQELNWLLDELRSGHEILKQAQARGVKIRLLPVN